MPDTQTDTDDDVTWSVTMTESEGLVVHFGSELSKAPYTDEAKLNMLGQALIRLGTKLMNSAPADEDEFDDDEDEN